MPLFVSTGGADGVNFSFDIGAAGSGRLVTISIGDEQGALIGVTGVTVDGNACTLVHDIVNTLGAGNAQQMWFIDEATLGASAGSVTVAFAGTFDTGHRFDAMLHTGVANGAPNDSGFDDTSGAVDNVTVPGIDCPANGLVVFVGGQGQAAPGAIASLTSPLINRFITVPASATLAGNSGIETVAQTAKTYTLTWTNADQFRGTAICATWAELVVRDRLHVIN